ncbi:MAG: DsbA family oxidoreductase [Alphaproteobacteria bacterium]|jgi:predicted DsbA family dithiol-disulfide isomerase|nr:DsbA family oxidoreductase [Alphaproteobacteria bacterium]
MLQIDVYSDTVCPWCFLGKRRLERALAERDDVDVSINYRAFQLNPDMPVAGMSRAQYLSAKFGSPERAENVYSAIARAGHSERIPFNFEIQDRMPNTIQSHRLIRFAGRHDRQSPIVEAVFQAFFLDGEDIGDDEALTRIAVRCGLESADVIRYLAGEEDRDAVLAEDLRARRMGIKAVPSFIINGAYSISGAQEPEAFYPLFDLADVLLAAE